MHEDEVPLVGGGSTAVVRVGDTVLREARPWSPTVVRLLSHLHERGFAHAPAPIDSGFAPDGREQLSYIDGDAAPACWSAEGVFEVGRVLRAAHDAASDFPAASGWMPWWGRGLPSEDLVVGHCDAAPWNFLARAGLPTALLDWDSAGPVGREWDVAQTAWLNAQLHDDDVAESQHLPDGSSRAALLRAFCDGYGLAAEDRAGLVERMIEVAVRTSA